MKWLHKLRISTKIYLLVAFLGTVAGLVGSAGIVAMRTYDSQVNAITTASTRALLGERVNGLVNAIVMDSRGVYMAENKERVEQFGKPLLENLKRIDALLEQWRPLVPASQMEQFQRAEQRTAEFIAFRTKLVELGRTEGAAAARAWGDNDANRTNRQALNKELQGIAAQNAELISTGSAELQVFYGTMLMTLVLLTVLGVGIAAMLAFLMVRMTVTRPLHVVPENADGPGHLSDFIAPLQTVDGYSGVAFGQPLHGAGDIGERTGDRHPHHQDG